MKKAVWWIASLLTGALLLACAPKAVDRSIDSPQMKTSDLENGEHADMKTIYLAGGCFWGMEKLMESIPGVADAVSGYANGTGAAEANYGAVSTGNTGFRETVKVTYDPEKISLDGILLAYFYVIDPTVEGRQGNDVGDQYQTGIYYEDEESKAVVERIISLEKARNDPFMVEMKPLKNFYPAEEYHQDYLTKNPNGYCHIPREEMALFSRMTIDPGDYQKPAKEMIREKLTEQQYAVTQENGTEIAFTGEYWDHFEQGIYVDVVTGEPLFSSLDKYESGCGWPAFSKTIDETVVVEKRDASHGMIRTEVRSRAGDSHLGHVFAGDSESPSGIRYCINSAALEFVPYAQMEQKGYGYLKALFPQNGGKSVSTPGTGVYQKISPDVFYQWMQEQGTPYRLVDVRTENEYDGGHIPGAILIPNETIGADAPQTLADQHETIVVYCRSGRRSAEAAKKLLALGYTNVYDLGGIIDWPYETVQ